ncbi:2-dehydro-3-deoxygalactonokinase [uncultured Cohaesibacter sp.]|uniref:2-dehydro-3-deoxygalactonokinase n=1 Tax=uncultured Cohaesibacter sp. TaxID=1002546 RepID=UPI00292DE0F2|nr:2-dehydro-3-deoxygalactonokinase [uncultured Cohaesibacter sp.]
MSQTIVKPSLIALDWGTSSLRGYLMGSGREILQERSSDHGIQNLPAPGARGFEQAFNDLCSDWLTHFPGLPVVAGGMVGSAQGWREAPYVDCPADVTKLASQAIELDGPFNSKIHIAPGVLSVSESSAPDIIRGEEIQIAGALHLHPELRETSLAVLPGTHSKWIITQNARIMNFATYMTGEIFSILRHHSILGRLMVEKTTDRRIAAEDAFKRGLQVSDQAAGSDLTHLLFATRTCGLMGQIDKDVLNDFLSGLLIGHEVCNARRFAAEAIEAKSPLIIIGADHLAERYGLALEYFGIRGARQLHNTAPVGLFDFAVAVGLVPDVKT